LRYFFHIGLFVQKERLEFRFYGLWTLKCEQRPPYLFILRQCIIYKTILHGVFSVCLRQSTQLLLLQYFVFYILNEYPYTVRQQYIRWTPGPDWGSDKERARKKSGSLTSYLAHKKIETSLKINSIGVVSRYTLIREQTDTKIFLYIYISLIIYDIH